MRRLAVLLVAGAVALAGCGSGDSSNDAKDGANGDTSPFSELLDKAQKAKYKVTYTSGDTGSEVFTLAQDPPRFAYVSDGRSTYVTADGAAVTCSGSGSSATCKEVPGSGDSYRANLGNAFGAVGAMFLSAAGSAIPDLLDIKTSEDQIAGRDAVCATLDSSTLGALGKAIKGAYSVCVDKDTGVMLLLESDDGSGASDNLTATKFEAPSDDDFTLPATPEPIVGQ
jgi:hypothetical protein